MKKILLTLSCLCVLALANAQQTPAANQSKSLLIQGATLHIGNGSVIRKC